MGKNVLLIDDEASVRRSVTMGLMQRGYHTEACESGMKALETLETYKNEKKSFDYAVVDVRLPDVDGLKLLKVIKFNYPAMPVIIITGYGDESTAEEVKTLKADAYLEKPFTMDDLADVLARVSPAAYATAYALVSIDPLATLTEVYRALHSQEKVIACDAIRGEYDLVLLIQAESDGAAKEAVEGIRTVPGVSEVALLTVETPAFGENMVAIMGSVDRALGRTRDKEEAYTDRGTGTGALSYVTFEIEKEKLEAIYPVLYFNDQVVYCDCTKGKYDIVALMKGTAFTEIEKTIRNKFKTLDGVLRIKEWPIITLF